MLRSLIRSVECGIDKKFKTACGFSPILATRSDRVARTILEFVSGLDVETLVTSKIDDQKSWQSMRCVYVPCAWHSMWKSKQSRISGTSQDSSCPTGCRDRTTTEKSLKMLSHSALLSDFQCECWNSNMALLTCGEAERRYCSSVIDAVVLGYPVPSPNQSILPGSAMGHWPWMVSASAKSDS